MKSPYFNLEHDRFRESVRQFITQDVLPYADEWERNRCIPKPVWQKMGQLGFLGLHHLKGYGGSQLEFFYSAVLLEELGRTGYAGFRVAVAVHAYMSTYYLTHAGNDQLKHRYLTPAIRGEKVSALAITEPQAGSDLSQLQTTAVRDSDNYIVNGTKKFVANGTTADFIVVAVRTSSATGSKRGATGISLIVVDTASEGLSAKRLDSLGWHCSDTAEVHFRDVRVPSSNLLGKLDYGFMYIMQGFQLERLVAALLALGEIDLCLEITCSYLFQRRVFGSPLGHFQALRHRMADIITEVEATRQLVYYTAWLYQQGELPVAECSMSKLKATELANRVVNACLQLHGARGYLEANPIARMYRDTRAATIAAGTSEIMREIISQIAIDEFNSLGKAAS